MKKIIEFFRDVKEQKRGAEEFEAMKPELTQDEIDLVEIVFSLMAYISHWSAEQVVCALGIIVESRKDKDMKALIKALGICGKFQINPLLVVKFIQSVGIELSLEELFEALSLCDGESSTDDSSEDDSSETLEDIQKELRDALKKFNEN